MVEMGWSASGIIGKQTTRAVAHTSDEVMREVFFAESFLIACEFGV
jgi:hypothetical protein